MDIVRVRKPDDWHLHFREGEMLTDVLLYSGRTVARALAEPNTKDGIKTSTLSN
jgi:dihydroorotase